MPKKDEKTQQNPPTAGQTSNQNLVKRKREVEEKEGMLGKAAPVSGLCGSYGGCSGGGVAASGSGSTGSGSNSGIYGGSPGSVSGGPQLVHVCSARSTSNTDTVEDMSVNSNDSTSTSDSVKGTEHSFSGEEDQSRIASHVLTLSVPSRKENLETLDRYIKKKYEEYSMPVRREANTKPRPIENALTRQYANEYIASLEVENKETLDKDETANEITKSLHRRMMTKKSEYVMVPVVPKTETRCKNFKIDSKNCNKVPRMFRDGPGVIRVPPSERKIKSNKKMDMPGEDSCKTTPEASKSLTKQKEEERDETQPGPSTSNTLSLAQIPIRHKDETPEERRQRKRLVKEYQRERRRQKKEKQKKL